MDGKKIKRFMLSILIFILTATLFAEEPVEVTCKLKKRTKKELVFDVFLLNNTEETLYFYPNGVFGYNYIENDTYKMILNYDADCPLASSHDPILDEKHYLEMIPGKTVKYRYKKNIQNPYNKKTRTYQYEKEIYDLFRIEFTLCVVDKSLKDLNSYDEYKEYMSKNILKDKWYVLYDKDQEIKKK